MSYIDDSLGHNETVLYRARFPWFHQASAWVLLTVFVVGGLMASRAVTAGWPGCSCWWVLFSFS